MIREVELQGFSHVRERPPRVVALLAAVALVTALFGLGNPREAGAQTTAPALLDCDAALHPTEHAQRRSASGADSTESFGCWLQDSWTKGVEGAKISAEVVTPVNDPESPDAATFTSPDYWCFTDWTGYCRINVHQAEVELGTTTVCFYLESSQAASPCASEPWDEELKPDLTDSPNDVEDAARITWHPATPFADRLEAAPDEQSQRMGTMAENSVAITPHLFDQFGNPYGSHTTVNLELFAGSPSDTDGNTPATPDATCTTAGLVRCTHRYTQTTTAGWDFWCVWIGPAPAMGTSADGQESCNGENLADSEELYGQLASPGDKVDVVRVAWLTPSTIPWQLDCDDPSLPGATSEYQAVPTLEGTASQVTYTCTVRNQSGQAVTVDYLVQGEVAGALNDPDAIDGASFESPDYSCSTGTDGVCTITVTQADGETGTGDVCFYGGSANEGRSLCSWELYDEATGGGCCGDAANDFADTVRISWEVRSPAKGAVDLTPESSLGKVGSSRIVTARVYDQFGDALAGNTLVKFRFLPNSPNYTPTQNNQDPSRSCSTAGTVSCSITVTSTKVGLDRLCGWLNARPDTFCAESRPDIDLVEIQWKASKAKQVP